MRIAAFPCPELTCRMLSEVPPGGVRDFPSSSEVKRKAPEKPESVRGDPEISETVRGSPKTPEGKLKRRVTFSDPETPKDDGSSDSDAPKFRSTVSLMIGRVVHQQEVDIPDSALVLTTPESWTGSDVMDKDKLGEKRFTFPSVTSASPEPEINGNHVRWTDSPVVEKKMESDVKIQETSNRLVVENNRHTVSTSISVIMSRVILCAILMLFYACYLICVIFMC